MRDKPYRCYECGHTFRSETIGECPECGSIHVAGQKVCPSCIDEYILDVEQVTLCKSCSNQLKECLELIRKNFGQTGLTKESMDNYLLYEYINVREENDGSTNNH